ncbi:MAG: hypothetical protein H7336_12085 [Bacteriovorax sp.]|nr:hypothetical protein [Bacteriovorax sp.]
MKKMIVLIGIIMSVTTVSAGEIVKMPLLDYSPTDGMDYVFNIKTTKFDKVILDCQSFITGMDFSNKEVLKSHVPLDMFMCEDLVKYLEDSKTNGEPVCIGLDDGNKELYFTRETGDDCN